MKPCTCCAKREEHVYQMGCPSCEARHISRMIKPHRQRAYMTAMTAGQDVQALKARVKAEWDLDQARSVE